LLILNHLRIPTWAGRLERGQRSSTIRSDSMRWMEADDLPLFETLKTPPSPATTGGSANSVSESAEEPRAAPPISVSELNRRVKGLLEANLALRWVRGELSNVVRAASGHWYFSLKDDAAQVRCVMFRQRAQSVAFTPENGIQVDVRALPSLYEARGEFQLGVEAMRRAGVGALFEAFEQLKRKLSAEGLFDEARKRPLPGFPRTVGIVTSTKAAALRDVLATFKRRAPMIKIILYPCSVQGADAAREIAAAIAAARARREVDALLICRGGGAAEDLWSFNEEIVARAMHRLQCETSIPIVSGVGHETDFTICDFVADVRAPTPTAAAEMLSPDTNNLRLDLAQRMTYLHRAAMRVVTRLQQQVDLALRGLISPDQRIAKERETLGHLRNRLARSLDFVRATHRQQLLRQQVRLGAAVPNLPRYRERIYAAGLAVQHAASRLQDERRQGVDRYRQALSLLNPQNVLLRGYAMVRRATPPHEIVAHLAGLKTADRVLVRFHDGEAEAEIKATLPP